MSLLWSRYGTFNIIKKTVFLYEITFVSTIMGRQCFDKVTSRVKTDINVTKISKRYEGRTESHEQQLFVK